MKKFKIVLPVLCLTTLLSGCGSAKSAEMNSYYAEDNLMIAESFSMAGAPGSGVSDMAAQAPRAEAKHVVAENRKLIRTVSMNMETVQFDETINALKTKVDSFQGYIEYSSIQGNSIYGSDNTRYANMRVRIPQDQLDEFLNEAQTAGNVTYRDENVNDVTLQYTDTQDHINALNAEKERLMELIAKAESVEALVVLEARLSEIRYQVESYQSQIKMYDNQVDYSTVSLYINEVKIFSAQSEDGIGERIVSGFKKSCQVLMVTGINLIVFFISSLPILIVLAIVVFIIIWIIRLGKKKSKKNKKKESES